MEPVPPFTAEHAVPPFAALLSGPYASISIVFKPRLHKSWKVKWNRSLGTCELQLPPALEHASESVKTAVLQWAHLVSQRRSKSRRNGSRDESTALRRQCEDKVHEYLRQWPTGDSVSPIENALRKKLLARNHRKVMRLNPKGRYHDLREIFAEINREYFKGELNAAVTWSARTGGLSTHSLQTDGEGNSYHLISISRGYDAEDAGPEIVGGVVYHECLHIVFPPRIVAGRRIIHSREFKESEKQYRHFDAWRHWHRHELPRKLIMLAKEKGTFPTSYKSRTLKSWLDYFRIRKTAR